MSKMNLNKISNGLFYLGIIVGILGYYRIYKVKSMLPQGACPVNNNRGTLFIGIFLLIASVITALIHDKRVKGMNK